MLEEGVNLKVLQTYLGHKNLQATEVYLHLTRRGDEQARRIVESIMNGPPADAPSQQEGRRERG
jgi:integrase